jgi:hypothetical protein
MQDILAQAGWPDNLLVTMAAIGQAESSGNPTAHNAAPPDDSYGLWQINMIGSLGPQRRARYGLSSNAALYDPVTNARIALDVYQQQGLRAWGPYVTGVYRRYLPASEAAYTARSGGSVTPGYLPDPSAGTNGGGGDAPAGVLSSGLSIPLLIGGLFLAWYLFWD